MLIKFPVEEIDEMIRTGGSRRGTTDAPAGFKAGDIVRARNINPATHTRLPRYVRDKVGEVVQDLGVFVFPDTNSLLAGEKPQHVYRVVFSATSLWGPGADDRNKLYIELWEDYIEPVERTHHEA